MTTPEKEILRKIIKYYEGRDEYNFQRIPSDVRANVAHDRWLEIYEEAKALVEPDSLDKKRENYVDCPINSWFGLSYAQYLTIPRSVLQAMPYSWRKLFSSLLSALDDSIDWRPKSGCYWVRLKDAKGRFAKDKFMDYRYPVKMPFKKTKRII